MKRFGGQMTNIDPLAYKVTGVDNLGTEQLSNNYRKGNGKTSYVTLVMRVNNPLTYCIFN